MSRPVELSRDEAELIHDLLMAAGSQLAENLADDIGKVFGMGTVREIRKLSMTGNEILLTT